MLKTPQTTLRRLMSGILSGSTDRHFFTERRFAFEPAFHEPEGLVLALVFEHGKKEPKLADGIRVHEVRFIGTFKIGKRGSVGVSLSLIHI